MNPVDAGSIALSVTMAIAAGVIGSFAVMRRMTLAADAISHIALPGIGLALLLNSYPILGAIIMLFVGTFLIWGLEQRIGIATEAIVGVVFALALAAGSLMTSGEELIDALFGSRAALSTWETGLGVIGALIVIASILALRNALMIRAISEDIALTCGINVKRLDLEFLLAFALTVALGLRFLGVLLMGSLIIIPVVTARRLARGLTAILSLSVLFAVTSTIAGVYLGAFLHRETGPLIVLAAGAIFATSLLRKQPAQ